MTASLYWGSRTLNCVQKKSNCSNLTCFTNLCISFKKVIYLAVLYINKQIQKLHSTTLNMVIKYHVGVQSVTAHGRTKDYQIILLA
jgi:hypothetical protein